MTAKGLDYQSSMHNGRAKQMSKRQQAAAALAAARQLAREARQEERLEAAMDAEYGPVLKRIGT